MSISCTTQGSGDVAARYAAQIDELLAVRAQQREQVRQQIDESTQQTAAPAPDNSHIVDLRV